jgi:hypothetical protein
MELAMQLTEMMLADRPGITTARGAKSWLSTLPLSDPRSSHHAISALLTELAETHMAPRNRLEILETIRAQAALTDSQYAARYAGKALPLGPVERNAFTHANAQLRALATAYLTCFEASLATSELAVHRALCLARAGGYFCDILQAQYRAGQGGSKEVLDDLQRLVELAAEYDIGDALVRDSAHPRRSTSVSLTYRRALLISMAGSAEFGRERDALFELAAFWEGRVSFPAQPGEARQLSEAGRAPGKQGVLPRHLRVVCLGRLRHVVDASRLSRGLSRRMRKLAGGATFDELRLPEALRKRPVADILGRARQAWCGDRASGEAIGGAIMAAGSGGQGVSLSFAGNDFEAMYHMIAGEPFMLNQPADATNRRSFDELFVFQHVARARDDTRAREAIVLFEDWEIVARGERGFNLRRARAGARFRDGQLIAMRLRQDGDDGPVNLAHIRRLCEPGDDGGNVGVLEAGVEVLKGKPHGVGVREAGKGQPWCAGFRLGSLHANDSITLVLPGGWYGSGRIIEMRDAGIAYRLRMDDLARRGRDFEEIRAGILA